MNGTHSFQFLLLLLIITLQPSSVLGNSPIASYSHGQPSSFDQTIVVNRLSKPHIASVITESDSQHSIMSQSRPWTVFVYLDGDNSMEEAAFDEIKEMETIGSTLDVNIIVYADFLSPTDRHGAGAECYNITLDDDPLNDTIWSQPLATSLPIEPNMGDPNTLLEFIKFGQSYSQSSHYLLVLWDHGFSYNGVCIDETSSNDLLLLHEIAWVLENDTIEPIDIIAFDASFMGELELAYELHNGPELIVFSEERVPTTGFPYNKFLVSLILFPESEPAQLAIEIVNRYTEAYSTIGEYYNPAAPITNVGLSVINTTRIDCVVNRFSTFVDYLLTPYMLETHYATISAARGFTQSFLQPDLIDLGGFADQLSSITLHPQIHSLAINLSSAIFSAVIFEQHLANLPGATGLGINFNNYMAVPLLLINNTNYQEFITQFNTIAENSNNAITIYHPQTYFGYLDGKDDSVFYKLIPQLSTTFTIHLTPMHPTDGDFDLYLYDENLNQLSRSVQPRSIETLQYNLIIGNTYYIRIWSYPGENVVYGLGAFSLRITQGALVNPVFYVLLGGGIVGLVVLIITIIWIARRYRRSIQRWRIEDTPDEQMDSA